MARAKVKKSSKKKLTKKSTVAKKAKASTLAKKAKTTVGKKSKTAAKGKKTVAKKSAAKRKPSIKVVDFTSTFSKDVKKAAKNAKKIFATFDKEFKKLTKRQRQIDKSLEKCLTKLEKAQTKFEDKPITANKQKLMQNKKDFRALQTENKSIQKDINSSGKKLEKADEQYLKLLKLTEVLAEFEQNWPQEYQSSLEVINDSSTNATKLSTVPTTSKEQTEEDVIFVFANEDEEETESV